MKRSVYPLTNSVEALFAEKFAVLLKRSGESCKLANKKVDVNGNVQIVYYRQEFGDITEAPYGQT